MRDLFKNEKTKARKLNLKSIDADTFMEPVTFKVTGQLEAAGKIEVEDGMSPSTLHPIHPCGIR